ncbi:MAG: hypothetical protein U1E83_08760 [Methylotetracoccus sp.]
MSKRFSKVIAGTMATGCLFCAAAQADLYEDVHGYPDEGVVLLVGLQNSPPFVNERARFAFSPFVDAEFDDQGGWVAGGRFVSVGDNNPGDPQTYPDDEVNLTGTIELLGPHGEVLREMPFPEEFKQPFVTGAYISEFTPMTAGRYAYVLSGNIRTRDDQGKLRNFKFADARFVCKRDDKLHAWWGDGLQCIRERTKPSHYAPSEPS